MRYLSRSAEISDPRKKPSNVRQSIKNNYHNDSPSIALSCALCEKYRLNENLNDWKFIPKEQVATSVTTKSLLIIVSVNPKMINCHITQ